MGFSKKKKDRPSAATTTSNTNIPIPPPHVKAWVPYLGSAVEMGAGAVKFIQSRSKALQSPVFTATILGDKCVFVGDPECINECFNHKYDQHLDMKDLEQDFNLRIQDCNEEELKEVESSRTLERSLCKQFWVDDRQALEQTMNAVQQQLRQQLLPKLVTPDQKWTQQDMYSMVYATVFQSTVGTVLACRNLETDEKGLQAFRDFEKGVLMMCSHAPKVILQKAYHGRSVVLEKLANERHKETATTSCPFMAKYTKDMKLSAGALQKSLLILMWQMCQNSAPAIFWALLHLMEDPRAWKACRSQVEKVLSTTTTTNHGDSPENDSMKLWTLEDLDQLTLLESTLWEAIRMYQVNVQARVVAEDFVLETPKGDFQIEKGSKLMPTWAVLYKDPVIFDKADHFEYDRFVDPSQTYKYPSGKEVPFFPIVAFAGGGDENICPGRKLFFYQAKLMLAELLLHYDMKLAPGQSLPSVDSHQQGIGVTRPDKEIQVLIQKRG